MRGIGIMDPADFREPTTGRIVRTPQGYPAFVPAPLPPRLIYDAALVHALSRADSSLGELSGLGRQLPNPNLLIAPYIRREAVLSSRIEGTRTELAVLFLATYEIAVENPSEEADLREVRNYVASLEYGIKRLQSLPLSLRFVRELHARLLKGVRGQEATLGEFRRSQNWIGPPGSTLASAPYVPPPVDQMHKALSDWERFLHDERSIPDLVRCALIHEQFEAIHPFLDGNGRIGRLLITLYLVARGRLTQPLLYLSAFFEAHRDEYYEKLQRVQTQGNWSEWICFFLTGVGDTARQAIRQAGALMELREKLRRRLRDDAKSLTLLDELFANPCITVSRAAEILKVSNPTARKAVASLVREGVLREMTGRRWGRIYLAPPILKAIETPPAP